MAKFIIELQDIKETPNGKTHINIEIRIEPIKANPESIAQELGYELIEYIDKYRRKNSGNVDKMDLKRY